MMLFLKKLHKWVGILIGLQVLLWLISGLIISLLDPAKVSGKLWSVAATQDSHSIPDGVLLEPDELPAEQLTGAISVTLLARQGKPVYRIKRAGNVTLLDASDGTVIVTGRADAEKLARKDFTGNGEIISIERGTAPDMETRDSTGDYWEVRFSDHANTTLYISVSTGEILERRNSYWRVRDFFWMLHIMDYSTREDFNNPLIILVIFIAVWLGISGFLLLFGSFNRHDFYFLNVLGKPHEALVTLTDPDGGSRRQVRLRKGSNLFLSLATHGINLPSICGGGGECGKCRVKFESGELPAPNTIEQGLIPRRLREQGFRLGCQHMVEGDITLLLAKDTYTESPK